MQPASSLNSNVVTLDILIPHYANTTGLSATLESVATQTWAHDPAHHLRVIVLDDGSCDADYAEVERVCRDFKDHSGHALILERLPQNRGRPFARNQLLELAQATYLAWLDAGDIWYPEKLDKQFAHLETCLADGQDADLLWISCSYDLEQNDARMTRLQITSGDQFAALLEGEHLRGYLWTMLATKKAFERAGRFDPDLPRLQDLDYCLAFLVAGGRISVPPAPVPLCCYVKTKLGRDARQVAAGHARILDRHMARIAQYPRDFRARLRARGPILAARFALANSAYLLALRYLLAAAWASPRHAIYFVFPAIGRRLQFALDLVKPSAGVGL